MKKYAHVLIMIAIALLLTACGVKESKEDVISKVEEKIDEVEKYYLELILDATVTDSNNVAIDESESVLKVNMNENTLESSGERIQDDQVLDYYSTEDATYAQINDGAWEDMTAQEEDFRNTGSFYPNIAQVIIDLKDDEDVEMSEKDGKYIFTFKGKSREVFKALEDPYSLSVSGVEIKDVEHDLNIIVDSETYYIDQVKNDMFAEKDGSKLSIKIKQTYEKINSIDDIKIPQEVIDEVSS